MKMRIKKDDFFKLNKGTTREHNLKLYKIFSKNISKENI